MDFTYEQIINKGSELTISNIDFENPGIDMLVVTEDNFVEHLSKQAAGLAYFGALTKMLESELKDVEDAWKNKYNEWYTYCSNLLAKTSQKKYVVRDVEAMVCSKHATDIDKWRDKINKKKTSYNVISTFYDSWKQKSFTLNNYTSLATANLLSVKDAITTEDYMPQHINQNVPNNVLSIVKKHQQNKEKNEI